jgi:type II secretory pathway predicted ATPase ExeA
MYNSYFGFTEAPFENKLDQKFLFLGEDHSEVLAALLYFIQESKGFAVVSGDVGTGKSMLIHCFLERIPKSVHPIVILNPNVTYHDLLHYIGKELKLGEIKENILELTDDIKQKLIKEKQQGKVYVLVVDEAHLLPNSSLEDIRLLSNIETQEQKLLQILLVGQYELSHKLDRPEMRQLRQRINISRFLSPLSPAETIQYINYRLTVAGSDFDSCFEPKCKSLIYKMSEGVPRKINQICDSALLICLTENRHKVNPAILKKARETVHTDQIFTPRSSSREPFLVPKLRKALIPATCAALLILGFWLGQKGFFGSGVNYLVNHTSVSSAQIRTGIHPEKSPEKAADLSTSSKDSTAVPKKIPARENNLRALSQDRPVAKLDQQAKLFAKSGSSATEAPVKPMVQPLAVAPNIPSATPRVDQVGQRPSGLIAPPGRQEKPSKDINRVAAKPEPRRPSRSPQVMTNENLASVLINDNQAPRQIVIKANDSLSKIALRWYPQNIDLGVEALILANLRNSKEDLIHPGQVLFLPEINFKNGIIKLRDDLYYASFGHFRSFDTLQKVMSNLSQHKVRYLILNTIDTMGATVHRVILGGYERSADLEKVLKLVKTNNQKTVLNPLARK